MAVPDTHHPQGQRGRVTEPKVSTDDPRLFGVVDGASFWRPAYMPPSGWTEHAPFAFWLIGRLKPGTLVELGVHNGYSYFTFCEAIQRHAIEARSFGVDTWRGDEHAGFYGEDVFEAVESHNSRLFSAFSTLVRSTFDDALPHFADSSVDLLHIDGRHFYDDIKHDFETWLPKVSDNGIVLMHDTNVRERGFGIHAFFDELRLRYPVFEFAHGHGLGVVAIGARGSQLVKELVDAASEAAPIYASLGGGLAAFAECSHLRTQLADGAAESAELRLKFEQLSGTYAVSRNASSEAAERATEREADLGADLAASQLSHDQEAERASQLARQVDQLQERLAEYQSSRSWRLTAPLRAAGRAVRSTFLR